MLVDRSRPLGPRAPAALVAAVIPSWLASPALGLALGPKDLTGNRQVHFSDSDNDTLDSESQGQDGHNLTLHERVSNLAKVAIAVHGGPFNQTEEWRIHAEADEVLHKVQAGGDATAEEIETLVEDVAWFMSANTAAKDGILVDAADWVNLTGVAGEDIGPNHTLNSWEGDMIPEDEGQQILFEKISDQTRRWVGAGRPWTGGRVNYCFAPDTSSRVKNIFRFATEMFEREMPCLKFEDVGWRSGLSTDPMMLQACQTSPAIFVMSKPNAGCYSYVGMTGMRSQQLQLHEPGCMLVGIVMHEIGHALGMAHEQSRPDRDHHVRIFWENIQSGREQEFHIFQGAYTGLPYDYLSLMHYDAYAFAKDRSKPTITRTDGKGHWQLGQRSGLSVADTQQVAAMYVGEVAECMGSAARDTGCIDRRGPDREDVCRGVTSCLGGNRTNCCHCGGGIKVQCYKGGECPRARHRGTNLAAAFLVLSLGLVIFCLISSRSSAG